MRYDKQTFTNVIVELDDHEFIGCHFEDCELVYTGAQPPTFYGCSFVRVMWTFAGAAENTLRFLATMYDMAGDEGRQLIEDTFDNIRHGWREKDELH
jgi:hypothetical protein